MTCLHKIPLDKGECAFCNGKSFFVVNGDDWKPEYKVYIQDEKTGDSLGGEEHEVAPRGSGSSPDRPTKKQRAEWHRRLRNLDRALHLYDTYKHTSNTFVRNLLPATVWSQAKTLDSERRRIRSILKCRRRF